MSSSGSSSGRSYSTGSSSGSSSSSSKKPSGPSFDSAASKAQRQAESKSAYTGRSSSTGSSTTSTGPTPWPTSKPSSSGKSYSSGTPSGTGAPSASTSASPRSSPSGRSYSTSGKKPEPGGYDTSAATAQRREESKAVFQKSQQPRPTYTDAAGTTRPIDPRDRQVEDLRRDWDYERWRTREQRRRDTFDRIPTPAPQAPVIVYRDSFSNWFWWWLLAQNLDTRSRWAYHHRDQMDEARYREMLRRDAQLEARVKQLEAEQVKRDPAHVPAGVDRDLMYDDAYVDAVVNPEPVPQPVPPPRRSSRILLRALLVVGILVFLGWLVFIKRWGGDGR